MKKLAIAQIVLGAVIVGSLVWFVGWAEPGYGSFTKLIEDGTREVTVHHDSGWIILLNSWKVVSFVLGLAVLGCGIAQFQKARRIL